MPRPARLVSRWYVAAALSLVGICAATGLALAIGYDGVLALAWAGAAAAALMEIAIVVALVVPRRTALPPADPSGSIVLRAPGVLVGSLLGSWIAVFVSAAFWVWVALTDFSQIDAAGPLLIMVLAVVGSLPELGRLLTGRLHRWQLTLTDR